VRGECLFGLRELGEPRDTRLFCPICSKHFLRSLMSLDNLCPIIGLWSADQYLAHSLSGSSIRGTCQ
jgi:hypothetical protein